MKEQFVSRQQLGLLPKRLQMVGLTNAMVEFSNAMYIAWQKKNWSSMRIMVVGAGGSFPAALTIAHCLRNDFRTPYVETYTPQTALRIINQYDNILNCDYVPQYDMVIGVSYSGKTPDIKAVFEACYEKEHPFLLLTGACKEKLREVYPKEDDLFHMVSYYHSEDDTGRERGLISMASTLAPAMVVDSNDRNYQISIFNFSSDFKFLNQAEKYVNSLDIVAMGEALLNHHTIHVLYDWITYPIAADIESKFTEAGIANVILHEKKNFSHGRYSMLYLQDYAMIINLVKYNIGFSIYSMEGGYYYRTKYDAELSRFLKGICKKDAFYLEMGNFYEDFDYGNIAELCKLPYLITAIGEGMDIDISKPFKEFPEEAEKLYHYQGEF